MKSNNKLKVVNALDLLQEVLYAFFDEKIKKAPDENWLKEITKPVQNQIKKQRKKKKQKTEEEIASKLLYEDLYALLTVIDAKWDQLNPILGLQNGDRASIIESLEFRNQLSHTRDLSLKETKRALETISFLLNSIKTTSESDNCIPLNIEKYILDIEKEQEEVERLQYQEKARREILDTPVSEAEEARIRKEYEELLKRIHFENAYLLKQALIHTSYKYEQPKLSKGEDNEQLEFLGDALLTFLSGDFYIKIIVI